jgi:hypothetical protein
MYFRRSKGSLEQNTVFEGVLNGIEEIEACLWSEDTSEDGEDGVRLHDVGRCEND